MNPTTPKFPGFGLPLNGPEPSGSFPDALDWGGKCITVREQVMLSLMNSITDKPEWDLKIFNDNITQKWRQEALDAEDMDVTESMLNWIIAELQDKATSYQKDGIIPIFDFDVAVVKSDEAIPSPLREDLRAACRQLEAVPSRLKDWHPGSDGKVLDLVHPSLFPLVYGRSKVLASHCVDLENCIEYMDKGETIGQPDMSAAKPYPSLAQRPESWSMNFQWLPCQVQFTNDRNVKISSYINNLHPLHYASLYCVIEKCIAKTIPLWDRVLSSMKNPSKQRIDMETTEYYWPERENMPEDFMPDEVADIQDQGDRDDQRQEAWNKTRILIYPEPGKYGPVEPSADTEINLKKQFESSGLQVIVKIANIELTPEKPEYEGGSWHIEGQMNERICASALYYYDSDNITESFLAFRQGVNPDEIEMKEYDQDDYEGVEIIYGIEQDGPRVQELGRVSTREGRLIAFPNVLQHRVFPFGLQDPSKPGHRKILALFLVDPHIPVLSTAHVPPQQKTWWSDRVRKEGSLSMLPTELVNKIVDEVSGAPMSMEEAKAIRLQLMEERKDFVARIEDDLRRYTFSFCEH